MVSIKAAMNFTSLIGSPPGCACQIFAGSRWIYDNEAMLFSKTVPTGRVHLVGRPNRRTMHANDERSRTGWVVACRHVKEIFSAISPHPNGATSPIEKADGRCGAHDNERGQSDEGGCRPDYDLPRFHSLNTEAV
jgi:hypothetical protein